jgi:peptidyl-prolyl cis-trans isomerase D
MLQAIRERAQGWIAWAIIILISIPFALWGIQEYLGVGGERIVAEVNGQEITERELNQRFQEFRMELRERLGQAYRPELFEDSRLRAEVLDDMIRNRLILQASSDMGLRAGDAQVRATILEIPAFQKGGRFDKEAYERAVGYRGMSTAQFEESVRASLMSSQLSQVVAASEITTDRELKEAVSLRRQQRSFGYIVLPVADFRSDDPVTDEQIRAYYDTEQDAFRTPEQVKLDYLVVNRNSDAGGGEEADEAALRELYQERLDSFRTPEEREARHILVTLDADADEAAVQAAREKIEAIKARLDAGEDFADLAREVSQDPGSAQQGGDLGRFGKGVMDPAFEQAAFALAEGQVSDPVRSSFGYHLIQVTRIIPEKVKPFEEVRDQLAAELRGGEAEQKYFELAETLGNLSYEHPDSLEPAAEALGLEVQHSDWLGRRGGAGVLSDPRVIKAAFSDDVLRQGNNSELIEVDSPEGQEALVVRVAEHQEATVPSLDEVREEIVGILRDQRAQEAAAAAAAAMAERIRQGEQPAQVAGAYRFAEPGLVRRDSAEVPSEILAEAFTLPAPGTDSPSVGVAELHDGGAAVVNLTEIRDGNLEDLDAHLRETEGQDLARSLARTYYNRLVDDLRRRADISIELSQSEETSE